MTSSFFEGYNQRVQQGLDLEHALEREWSAYKSHTIRSHNLFELWQSIFPKHIHLSYKINTLNFLDISDNIHSSKYTLIIGRSIGIKCSEYMAASSTSYLDNHRSIIELFKLLYSYGDTIYNYVSQKNKAPLLDLTKAIRESPNFLQYLYPAHLKLKLPIDPEAHIVHIPRYPGDTYQYPPKGLDYIRVEGTSSELMCYLGHGTLIYDSSEDSSPLQMYGVKPLLDKVISTLNMQTKDVVAGKGFQEIRDKLSNYILVNTI